MNLPAQFPNIYRFITELPRARQLYYGKILIVSFVSGFLLMASVLKSAELIQSVQAVQTLDQQRNALLDEKTYWEQVVAKHEGYRDAYFKLAVISYQLGEREQMHKYLDKALEIDPNFQEGREFKSNISGE